MTQTAEKPEVKLLEAAKPFDFGFKLGADPEFTIIAGTRPMHAKEIFTTFFRDIRPATEWGYNLTGGNIGWDNHKQTGELRPLPGRPEEVVKNMKTLFAETSKRMPSLDFGTLTVAGPTGGHIHFEIPEAMNPEYLRKSPRWMAMERAMASFSVLVLLSENSLSRELRKRGGNYGNFMDFRYGEQFKHKSGNPGFTMEMRGPTAEWMTTEKLATGTLAYLAICWDAVLKHSKENRTLDSVQEILFRSQKQGQEVIGPLLANYGGTQKTYLNKIKPFVRNHPAYKEYKEALELVLHPELAKAAKEKAHFSVLEGMNLSIDSKSISTKDFINDDKIEEQTSKLPEAIIRNLSSFAWNKDINVELFATALAKRCIALGWKPQHEYYLFGLQKGFNNIIIRDEGGDFVHGMDNVINTEDFALISKKFSRLAPKATPAYGRFIHPRSGKLVSESEIKRVMIGIPYSIRQKNDFRSIVKLVLKFEKSPKDFKPFDPKGLPEGKSSIKAAIEEEDRITSGITQAMESADPLREIPREHSSHEREESQMDDMLSGEVTEASTVVPYELFRTWQSKIGEFSFGQARRLVGRGSLDEMGIGHDDFIAWYTGNNETIINYGADLVSLTRDLEFLFDVPMSTLERIVRSAGNGSLGNGVSVTDWNNGIEELINVRNNPSF